MGSKGKIKITETAAEYKIEWKLQDKWEDLKKKPKGVVVFSPEFKFK